MTNTAKIHPAVHWLALVASIALPSLGSAQASPTGIWKSNGYGVIADFSKRTPRFYDVTASSCLPSGASPYLEEASFTLSRNTLLARLDVDAVPISFERISALPAVCRRGGTPQGSVDQVDPQLVLSVLCANFDEQYAFSALHKVDFRALCKKTRSALGTHATPEQLWDTLSALIDQTEDDHVTLSSTTDPTLFHDARPLTSIVLELLAEFEAQSAEPDPAAFQAAVLERIRENTESYLSAPTEQGVDGVVRWSRIGNEAGYIAIDNMTSNRDGASGSEDVELFAEAIDAALAELHALPTIILDLRLNTGGYDPVSLSIASRFTERQRLAFTVEARAGSSFTSPYPVAVKHAPNAYAGRVIILTSEISVSAAETFLLALLERPNTYRVGETTAGFFSDMLPRLLPNGWLVTLSNERYRAANGKVYEGIGLAPHVAVDCFPKAERDAGRDGALEAALALARKR